MRVRRRPARLPDAGRATSFAAALIAKEAMARARCAISSRAAAAAAALIGAAQCLRRPHCALREHEARRVSLLPAPRTPGTVAGWRGGRSRTSRSDLHPAAASRAVAGHTFPQGSQGGSRTRPPATTTAGAPIARSGPRIRAATPRAKNPRPPPPNPAESRRTAQPVAARDRTARRASGHAPTSRATPVRNPASPAGSAWRGARGPMRTATATSRPTAARELAGARRSTRHTRTGPAPVIPPRRA